MKWIKTLLTVFLMAGMCSEAEILASDAFDTAASADAANGIYAHDTGVDAAAPIGGAISGFDASLAWTATSGYLRTHTDDLLCLVGSVTSRIGSRQLAAGIMTGKTTACGLVVFNFAIPDGYDQGSSKIGFTTEAAVSGVGATMRIIWDSTASRWDLEAVYNNGAIVVGEVMNGISLNTDYSVMWEMDETADTLKVWVDPASSSDAPTATFTDYAGSVSTIDDLYVQYNGFDDVDGASTTARDGLRYKKVLLADSMEELFPAAPGILASDAFDTAVSTDAVNGIYAHDTGVDATAPIGGGISGFDASLAWTATSSYLRTHTSDLLCLVGSVTSRTGSRQLAAGTMSGKTTACGQVVFNFAIPDGYDQGSSKIGFTTETAASGVGATMRIVWDSTASRWDLEAVYNNGAIIIGEVVNGISLNTDYSVMWEMDETADTLKVWVNPASPSDAPTATFTDYAGSVSTIDDLYVQYNGFDDVDGASATARDGLRYKEVLLADSLEFLSFPAVVNDLVAYDEFVTSTDIADPTNGVYKSGTDLSDLVNKDITGGTVAGFGGTNSWVASAFYDAYAQKVRLIGRTSTTPAWASRTFTESLTGETELYASLVLRVADNAEAGAQVLAGFSTPTMDSTVGAAVGYIWDGSNWDMVLRYRNAGGPVFATIHEDIMPGEDNAIYWSMNSETDTIKVWVNEISINAVADLMVTDWEGSVETITDFVSNLHKTGSGNDAYLDTIQLGRTAEAIGMVTETVSDLVVYDEFVTSTEVADPTNGVYKSGTDLSDLVNKDVTGGTVVGFGGTNSWVASAFYDAYAQKVRLIGRTSTTPAWANRTLAESLTGETELYASLTLRVAGNAEVGAQVLAGFSTPTMDSAAGAAVGYKWDGSNWDMVLRYKNAGGVAFATIREDITPNEYNAIYWSMNSETDTIKVWVNEIRINALADLVVADWEGSVETITDFVSNLHKTGSGNDAYLDAIQLGRTAEAIGMVATPVSGFLFSLSGAPKTDLHVASSAVGNGSGVNVDNAAAYTDEVFWSRVQKALGSDSVTVTLLNGSYQDGLILNSFGNAVNTLTLSGASSDGVLFNGTGSSVQLDLAGCQNIVVENLNFTGDGSGYALRITESSGLVSSDITVRDCDWYDMTNIVYGASGVHNGSHHVTFDGCSFERIGITVGSHMIYNSYDADYISVVNSHFEDCAGSYIRFRGGSDYAVVSNCTFVSTQTYSYRSSAEEVFVDFPVFNDVNPGDEVFSLYGTVVDNTFTFNSTAPTSRVGIRYYHKGYDPTGWSYLMNASEGIILEGSDGAAKKSLLLNECGIDFDQITLSGNIWNNEAVRILFASYADYGATSQGWDAWADISDIVY